MIQHIDEKYYSDINVQKYSHTFDVAGGLPGRPECQYVHFLSDDKEMIIQHFVDKFKKELTQYLDSKSYKISDFI